MLIAAAMSHPAKIAIVLMAGIIVYALVDFWLKWMERCQKRVRKDLLREARDAHAVALSGLRNMARVFTDMPEHPLELSDQGARLLDSQARTADAFEKLCRRYPTMSRERRSRQLMRMIAKLHHQEARVETFQKSVLRAVSDQVRRGIVSPPAPGRSYRAVFTLLDHRLPMAYWPVMEEVLSTAVTLRMQDVDGDWHPVPLKFSRGSRAMFSRKYLERAVALKMIIESEATGREVFEYEVHHVLPVKPMRRFQWRLPRLIPSRSPGCALSRVPGSHDGDPAPASWIPESQGPANSASIR